MKCPWPCPDATILANEEIKHDRAIGPYDVMICLPFVKRRINIANGAS